MPKSPPKYVSCFQWSQKSLSSCFSHPTQGWPFYWRLPQNDLNTMILGKKMKITFTSTNSFVILKWYSIIKVTIEVVRACLSFVHKLMLILSHMSAFIVTCNIQTLQWNPLKHDMWWLHWLTATHSKYVIGRSMPC